MSGDRHGPVRVEVADDDAPEEAVRAGGAGPTPRGRTWWAAGLAVALGVGLVAAARVSAEADRRDEDDVARLAFRSGFTASLREPLEELWRADGRLVGAGSGVVVLEERGTTPSRLVARHAGTGEERWTGAWAPPEDVARCEGAAALLLCEVVGSGYGSPNTDEVLGEVPGALLAVDPADGGVVAAFELDGRTVGWAVLDDDAVVARRAGDRLEVRRLEVSRRDPGRSDAGGLRTLWSTDVALPSGVTATQLTVRAEHGAVVVEGRVGTVLDGDDGAVLVAPGPAAEGSPVSVVVSPAGALVSTGPGSAEWFDRRPGAARPSVLLGRPVAQAPDDGSTPEVVLLEQGLRLVAVEAASGAVLWERPEAPWRQVARRAGSVLVVEPGRITRVDARTGEERWVRPSGARPERPPGPGAFLLDARRVLLGASLTGGPPAVTELDRGVQVWVGAPSLEGALRPGTGAAVALAVADGAVVAWGAGRGPGGGLISPLGTDRSDVIVAEREGPGDGYRRGNAPEAARSPVGLR